MNELSDFQKKTKAKTIADNLGLAEDLSDLDQKLTSIFADKPPAVRDAVSKEEVSTLVAAIKQGTADNEKIARFLDLAGKLGLSA